VNGRWFCRCWRLSFHATSREPLGIPAETTWPLDCLVLPVVEESSFGEQVVAVESVRLFIDRAQALLPTFAVTPESLSAIVRICRSVDGLPLGIELAGTHVRVPSVQQIVERLEQDIDLLSSRNRLLPHRQQSFRAALNWSHALLPEPISDSATGRAAATPLQTVCSVERRPRPARAA